MKYVGNKKVKVIKNGNIVTCDIYEDQNNNYYVRYKDGFGGTYEKCIILN